MCRLSLSETADCKLPQLPESYTRPGHARMGPGPYELIKNNFPDVDDILRKANDILACIDSRQRSIGYSYWIQCRGSFQLKDGFEFFLVCQFDLLGKLLDMTWSTVVIPAIGQLLKKVITKQ